MLRRFDLQLAKALGESMFEKSLREKVSRENSGVRWELGQLQQQLEVRQGTGGCLDSQKFQHAPAAAERGTELWVGAVPQAAANTVPSMSS